MDAGILGSTFSVLWIVLSHSSAPALQFCQLVLSGEIFSHFVFIPFIFDVILEGSWENLTSGYILKAMMSHVWNYSDHMCFSLLLRVHMCLSEVLSPRPRDPGDAIILIIKPLCLLFPLREEFSPELRLQPQERRKGNLIFSWLFGNFSFTRNCLSSTLVLIELRQEKRNQFTLHMLHGKKPPFTKHYGICREGEKKINPSTNKISALFLHLLLLCPYLGLEHGSHDISCVRYYIPNSYEWIFMLVTIHDAAQPQLNLS